MVIVKKGFKKIDFETWIKSKLKYKLKDNEMNQLLTLEDAINKVIKEIYEKLNYRVMM